MNLLSYVGSYCACGLVSVTFPVRHPPFAIFPSLSSYHYINNAYFQTFGLPWQKAASPLHVAFSHFVIQLSDPLHPFSVFLSLSVRPSTVPLCIFNISSDFTKSLPIPPRLHTSLLWSGWHFCRHACHVTQKGGAALRCTTQESEGPH